MQLFQEAAVCMRVRSTDCEQLSRKLRYEIRGNLLSFSTEAVPKSSMQRTAEKDDLLLLLYDYKVAKRHLKSRVSEKLAIVKVMMVYVEQLYKNVSLLEEGKRLLQKTRQQLMRSRGRRGTAVGMSVARLVKIVATRFIEMEMCFSSTV